jgi:hypothetical protein
VREQVWDCRYSWSRSALAHMAWCGQGPATGTISSSFMPGPARTAGAGIQL